MNINIKYQKLIETTVIVLEGLSFLVSIYGVITLFNEINSNNVILTFCSSLSFFIMFFLNKRKYFKRFFIIPYLPNIKTSSFNIVYLFFDIPYLILLTDTEEEQKELQKTFFLWNFGEEKDLDNNIDLTIVRAKKHPGYYFFATPSEEYTKTFFESSKIFNKDAEIDKQGKKIEPKIMSFQLTIFRDFKELNSKNLNKFKLKKEQNTKNAFYFSVISKSKFDNLDFSTKNIKIQKIYKTDIKILEENNKFLKNRGDIKHLIKSKQKQNIKN